MNINIKNSKFWWLIFAASVICFFAVGSISSTPGHAKWVYNIVGSISFICMIAALVSLITAIILTRAEKRSKKAKEHYDAGMQAISDGDWEKAKELLIQANSLGHANSDAKLDEAIQLEAKEYYDKGLQAISDNKRDEAENWLIKAKVWEHPGAEAKLAEIKSL